MAIYLLMTILCTYFFFNFTTDTSSFDLNESKKNVSLALSYELEAKEQLASKIQMNINSLDLLHETRFNLLRLVSFTKSLCMFINSYYLFFFCLGFCIAIYN